MPAQPYIPAADAAFATKLAAFAAALTAAPTTYGITAPTAATFQGIADAFATAFATASDPATRTSATIAAKDAARVTTEQAWRPLAQSIRDNAAVTDEAKVGLGLNLPNTSPTPIPAPTSAPQLALDSAAPLAARLRYTDSGQGSGKAKPEGVIGCQIARAVGTVAAVDPAQAAYLTTVTKAPFTLTHGAGDVGKVATLFARWMTRAGPGGQAQVGPWSAPLVFNLM